MSSNETIIAHTDWSGSTGLQPWTHSPMRRYHWTQIPQCSPWMLEIPHTTYSQIYSFFLRIYPIEQFRWLFVQHWYFWVGPIVNVSHADASHFGFVSRLGKNSKSYFPTLLYQPHELFLRDHIISIRIICFEGIFCLWTYVHMIAAFLSLTTSPIPLLNSSSEINPVLLCYDGICTLSNK